MPHHHSSMTHTAIIIDGVNNLPEALFCAAKQHASEPAQWFRDHNGYQAITYAEMEARIKHIACGLIRTGVEAGDRIALLMENRPEWAVIDYAILSIGAVTVPLYCTYNTQDISQVLNDSGAIICITSDGKLLQNIIEASKQCPCIQRMYAITNSCCSDKVALIADLESADIEKQTLQQRLNSIDRDTLATLAYTSGTTAQPKGVMLSHGNILSNLASVPPSITLDSGSNGDRFLSFLPLAHMLERTGGHFLPYTFGLSVAFAERPDTIAKNMVESHPSVMVVVPRMLEVMRARILAQLKLQPLMQQKMFNIYMGRAKKKKNDLFAASFLLLLDRIVGRKIRSRFGGRLRAFISGGAPLPIDIAEFFEALGIPVMEGYGLTESAPLLAVNPMSDRRAGTVGIAGKGVELHLADDGEVLARGPNIMIGYWNNKEASEEALIDGWLHTGDIGFICPDGYLTITDRKKDIIINSGGENISPQRVEAALIAHPKIDQCVIYGDQKPYLIALITPNKEACISWAQKQGLPASDWQSLCESEILKKHLQSSINTILKPLNPFEHVRRIHLRHEPFSIESGTLTPTMKLKRRIIYARYADIITSLYN